MRDAATGKLMRTGDGGGPGPEPGVDCVYCDAYGLTTPYQLEVTFTGLILCSCCCVKYGSDEQGRAVLSWNKSPNGPWILTQKGDASCVWQTIDYELIRVDYYSLYDSDCSDITFTTYKPAYLTVYRKADDKIRVIFFMPDNVPGNSLFDSGDVNTESPDSYCVKGTDLANINAVCYTEPTDCWVNNWAKDGTATVVEI